MIDHLLLNLLSINYIVSGRANRNNCSFNYEKGIIFCHTAKKKLLDDKMSKYINSIYKNIYRRLKISLNFGDFGLQHRSKNILVYSKVSAA